MCADDWEKIKLITSSEHHFNDLCFKIRALASTWLLATFAGVGFLLTESLNDVLYISEMIVLLGWISSVGIFVLWILDLRIYQKLLSAWFNSRKKIEEKNQDFPQIWKRIIATQPNGSAFVLLKIFYITLCSVPLMLSIYIGVSNNMSCAYLTISLSLMIFLCGVIFIFSRKNDYDDKEEVDDKNNPRI